MTVEKKNYVMFNNDGICHDLHPVINGTQCRIRVDHKKMQVKGFVEAPMDAQICEACTEAQLKKMHEKEQRNLHKKFEETKYKMQQPPKRKNTLGRKQVHNRAQNGFSFD